jgi:hypothetical protein
MMWQLQHVKKKFTGVAVIDRSVNCDVAYIELLCMSRNPKLLPTIKTLSIFSSLLVQPI